MTKFTTNKKNKIKKNKKNKRTRKKIFLVMRTPRIYFLCCCSVAQSCHTLCDPTDWSMPGFPVPNQLPEFAKIQVHWVDDAIQPSQSLSPPCPLALRLSQHQSVFPVSGVFTSGGQNIGASASASVLPVNIQGWFALGLTGLIGLIYSLNNLYTIQHKPYITTYIYHI